MTKMEFDEKVSNILRKKMFAVSEGVNFKMFHFPFKNEREFNALEQLDVEKKVSLFCPLFDFQKGVNLWLYSGLENTVKIKKDLLRLSPSWVGIPKTKKKTKWQSVFSMNKVEVFNFCMKRSERNMIVSSRYYDIDSVVQAIGKDIFEQYCERHIDKQLEGVIKRRNLTEAEKEEHIQELRRSQCLRFLSSIDAIEVVRATEGFPLLIPDEGAKLVQTKAGYPMQMREFDGEIRQNVRKPVNYEGFKVVMYQFKDKETKTAVDEMVELIGQNVVKKYSKKDLSL